MSKFGYSELQSLMLAQDVCSTIDNSELTRRISRLKPESLKERPKTQIKEKKLEKIKYKIIPELKLAVDVLKTRLKENNDEKTVSRPCTRLKVERVENNLSPGCYHMMSLSIGGYEFSKVPRLDDSIEHQISALVRQRKVEKIENFEKVNKKIVKNMYEFQLKIHEKTKKHNRKVIRVLENVKTRKIEEIQQKKQEFLYKTMNGQWKEQCRDLIFRSKTLWSQLIIFSSISYTLRTLLSRKKVIIKNVQKYIKFLRMISKILGIFMVLLRRKRKYLEYKTVKSFAPPLISHIAHEIKVHERAVNKIIWKIVNCNHLYLFMSFWKRSLYIVKRCIKRYLRVREARLVAMTHMLRKFGHNTVKDSRRVSLNTTSGLIGLGIAAQKRKKQIFSEFLRKFMQNHLATSKSSQQSLNFFSNIPQTATQLLSLISQPDSTRHRKRNTDIFNFN